MFVVDSSPMVLNRLVWDLLKLLMMSNQLKNSNLEAAYHFRVFMLDK